MTREYFSPGRVNLIGEHTDYNGGLVFPCALSMGIHGTVSPRKDLNFTFTTATFPRLGTISLSLSEILAGPSGSSWTNYPAGVLKVLHDRGFELPFGFDLLIDASLPNGSGLSSSASLEMLTAVIAQDLYGLEGLSREELALIAKQAENTYCGVNCGIMDSFAISLGKEGSALLLDTNSLSYEYIPLELGSRRLVIINTNKKRKLSASAYNTRRAECEAALAIVNKSLASLPEDYGLPRSVSGLCGLTPEEWDRICLDVKDPVLKKRARHAVYENCRTKLAAEALREGKLSEFGHLMNNSHLSLKEDYEVTGPELDTLAAAAQAEPGCLGARMTGAGFGGCAVCIVEEAFLDTFIGHVGEKYLKAIGYAASFYTAKTGDGTRRIL